ncbi:MAG: hypothetical protein HY368_03305 [Candidatus Aenigmarchaeota archaeon]|nr:hypothetical protein [Candidatus Aenigmarchaeota archaeon]
MGIFSAIKKRLGRGDDYGDEVKSAVLDEPFPPLPSMERTAPKYDERFGSPAYEEKFPREPEFPVPKEEQPLTLQRPGLDEPSANFKKEYDIMDRLNLIEAQLSAIRSQTETINERLKNMEARLVRRY